MYQMPPFVRIQKFDDAVMLSLPQMTSDVELEITNVLVGEFENNYVVRAFPLEDGRIPADRPFVIAFTVGRCEKPPARPLSRRDKGAKVLGKGGNKNQLLRRKAGVSKTTKPGRSPVVAKPVVGSGKSLPVRRTGT